MLSDWVVYKLITKFGVRGAVNEICKKYGYSRKDAKFIVNSVNSTFKNEETEERIKPF